MFCPIMFIPRLRSQQHSKSLTCADQIESSQGRIDYEHEVIQVSARIIYAFNPAPAPEVLRYQVTRYLV